MTSHRLTRAPAGAADDVTQTATPTAPAHPPARRRIRPSRLTITYGISLVGGIAIWWVLAATVFQAQHTLPTPPQVVSSVRQLAVSGELWSNIEASLLRVLTGFVIGVAVALPEC